jgi:hypothetical protein
MLSYPMFKDLRDQEGVFDGVLCWRPEVAAMDDGKGTEQVAVELVSAAYFDVLGVPPALGRTFIAEDETAPGANPVIVLTHDFWRTRFGGDPNVVGRTLLINGSPLVVVGVAAPGFRSASLDFRPTMFLPITMKTLITPGWSCRRGSSRASPAPRRKRPCRLGIGKSSSRRLWRAGSPSYRPSSESNSSSRASCCCLGGGAILSCRLVFRNRSVG